eukprot:SAG11_NODE_1994_length_3953_cov_2.436430_7_plen_133_part_00
MNGAKHTHLETLASSAPAHPQRNCSAPRRPCAGSPGATYCPTDPTPDQCLSQESSSHYSHAQYGNRSVAFIKNWKAAGAATPFFVFVGTTGPHLPAQPAPWHQAIADAMNISAPRRCAARVGSFGSFGRALA